MLHEFSLANSIRPLHKYADENSGAYGVQIFNTDFTAGQVTKAARVKNATLQTWIARGVIIGHGQKDGPASGVDMPGRPGTRRSFTFFNVMEVATAAALIEAGVDVRSAFRAAGHFAHAGSRRLPSLPFPGDGDTILCVAADRSYELQMKRGENLYVMARHYLGNPRAFTTLNVSDVFDEVAASLGFHPQEVMDEAYKGSDD